MNKNKMNKEIMMKGLEVFKMMATVYFVLLGAAGCVLLPEKSSMGLWASGSGD